MPYRNNVSAIKKSPGGVIWVATGQGLGRYNDGSDSFTWFQKKTAWPPTGSCVVDFDRQGNVWAGSMNGLSYYDGKSFRNYAMPDGLVSNFIMALYYSQRHNTLFVGTDVGLQYIEGWALCGR